MIIDIILWIAAVLLAYLGGWATARVICRSRADDEMPIPDLKLGGVISPDQIPSIPMSTVEELKVPKVNKAAIFQNAKGQWRWRIRAANYKTIATSGESYINRSDAEEALHSVLTSTEVVDVDEL